MFGHRLKYIRTNYGIVLFSDVFAHNTMRPTGGLISAGFCSISVNTAGDMYVECWGESVTLDLKSNKEDAFEIEKMILGK